jgi:FKBP-type peptidyl-prolyl cis-trans isomerase 2
MRRYDYTKKSLMVSLVCIMFFGGYILGIKRPEASSFRSPVANSSSIVEGSNVTIEYVATVPGSTGVGYGNVSEFIQGRYEIVRALEQAIVGMKPGEEKQVELSPEEGFGAYDDKKKVSIPTTQLPPGTKEGDVVQNDLGDFAMVLKVSTTMAVLDYNHPLAGNPLVVQLKILKVENP